MEKGGSFIMIFIRKFSIILDVGGSWSDWGAYGECSASCGTGSRTRTRTCGGVDCSGEFTEKEDCNMEPCIGK